MRFCKLLLILASPLRPGSRSRQRAHLRAEERGLDTLLLTAASLSTLGLLALSMTNSGAGALAASTVFALGVCYFWPTMLGVTSEWFPAGGALLLAIIGGAGNLSVALILPLMGRIYDLRGAQLALRYVAILPVILIAIFGAIWIRDRAKGGHHAVQLAAGR